MKEYTKKQVDSIIKENMSDVEEMANRPKGTQSKDRYDKSGNKIYRQCVPLFADDNPTPLGGYGTPDAWIVNINQVEGGDVLCVPLDCEDIEEFMVRKKDLIEQLKIKYKLEPQIMRCRRDYSMPVDQDPVLKVFGIRRKNEANTRTFHTWSRLILYPLLREIFGTNEVKNRFEVLSLPPIEISDDKNIDNHGETTQTKLEYATHNNNSYESKQDFLEAVEARIFDADDPEKFARIPEKYKTYAMARQFNKNFRKWVETKKSLPEYKGKTPKYMLDAYGLEQLNLDITVRTDFKITGNLVGDNFKWEINFITKFGDGLKEGAKNRLGFDKNIQIFRQVPVSQYLSKLVEPEEEGNKLKPDDDRYYTLYHVEEVIETLKSGLLELREKLFTELDPVEMLDKANVRAYDVDNRNIQESKFKRLFKEAILKSLKKPLRK